MNMKVFSVIIFCLACSCITISCDKESDTGERILTQDEARWGYARGTVAGNEYSLDNTNYNSFVRTIRSSDNTMPNPRPSENGLDLGPINTMGTSIYLDGSSCLGILVYDITPGVRFIGKSWGEEYYDSYVRMEISDVDGNVLRRYIPSVANPLKLEITKTIWTSDLDVVMEAVLSGFLYNKEDPKDCIAVDIRYGTC